MVSISLPWLAKDTSDVEKKIEREAVEDKEKEKEKMEQVELVLYRSDAQ